MRLPLLAAALASGLGFALVLGLGAFAVNGESHSFEVGAFGATLGFAILPYLPLVVFSDTRTISWIVVSGINLVLATLGVWSLASAPLLASSNALVIGTALKLLGPQMIAVLTVMIAVPIIWLVRE